MANRWRLRMGMLVFWIVFWETGMLLFSRHTVSQNLTLWLTVQLVPALAIWCLSSFVYGAVGGVLAGLLFGLFFADLVLWPYDGNDGTYFLIILGVATILGGILGHFLNPRPKKKSTEP
ncbi:MAG: hypothetical protein Q7J31_08380 [Syntrophales bacterium]|nr:hypothetical protein [Syntrophales bacterium]